MKLILDNNVLFAVMKPKSVSSYLFFTLHMEVLAPVFLWAEFNKYKKICLTKSGLSEQEFEIWLKDVQSRIITIDTQEYKKFFKRALSAIPDVDDVSYIALALAKNAIIWSEDKHFSKQSLVKVYTTKELVELLLKGADP